MAVACRPPTAGNIVKVDENMKTKRDTEVNQKLQSITEREVNLWPAIAAQIKPRRSLSPKLVIPVLLTFLIIGFVWLLSPRAVSAAEIVDRAQTATQSDFEGIIDGKLQLNDYPTPDWIYWQRHYWVESPDKQRKESYIAASKQQVIPRLDNKAMLSIALSQFAPHDTLKLGQLQNIDVKVGDEAWGLEFRVEGRELKEIVYHSPYRVSPPSEYRSYSGILMSTDNLSEATDLDHATQFLSTRFEHFTLRGQAIVAGRNAYTVVFTGLKPDKKIQFDDEIVTAWYDQQTYRVLGIQLEVMVNGQFQLWGEWHFSTFEVNPNFAPQTFEFTPPSGIPVEDTTSSTPPATDNP